MKINKFLQTIVLIASLVSILTACGQKGFLYLPKHKQIDNPYLEIHEKEKPKESDENSIADAFGKKDEKESKDDEEHEEHITNEDLFLP